VALLSTTTLQRELNTAADGSVTQVLAPRLLANNLHPSSLVGVWNAIFFVFFAQAANKPGRIGTIYNGCDCELPIYCVVPKHTGSGRDTALNNQ
jgi:hypothetical protein